MYDLGQSSCQFLTLCECTFWLCARVSNAICAASNRTQRRLPHVVLPRNVQLLTSYVSCSAWFLICYRRLLSIITKSEHVLSVALLPVIVLGR